MKSEKHVHGDNTTTEEYVAREKQMSQWSEERKKERQKERRKKEGEREKERWEQREKE